jgi:adenylate cyclase
VGVERKLTAILCADVYGYSRLMGGDEEATLVTLTAHRKIIDILIEQHHGRFVNSAGDSVLAEFASVVEAVNCAVDIQPALKAENAKLPPERRMEFRIGVNLGDVMVEGDQIYGDGINVAARLESLAEPGGICISGTVHEHVDKKLALNYQDLGAQHVKNIPDPVHVLRVLTEPGMARGKITVRVVRHYWRQGALSLAGLVLVAAIIVLAQYLSLRPPTTTASIPPAQKPALPLPNIPSIAVLPFTNMSGDPQQEYFSDGITDDLITSLSRFPGLFVIARNSTFTYKGKAATEQQVGRELGVQYVLEGGVRKAGDQVRITAQLADAATGTDLWAESYDRPMKDIFALQDEIVRRIVTTMGLQLDLWEKYRVLLQRRTDNLEAYDYILRALNYEWGFTKDGNTKARELCEKAIELDSEYADAYVLMSNTYWLDWIFLWNPTPHTLDRAFESVRKALALNDSHPYARVMLGRLLVEHGHYDAAIAEIHRAIAIAPNLASTYFLAAETLSVSGKPGEALEIAQKAMRLDPKNSDWYLMQVGLAYLCMGRSQDAVLVLKKFLVSYPNHVGGSTMLIAAYVESGMTEQAHAEAAEVKRLNPQFSLEVGDFKGRSNRFIYDLRKAGLK